MLFLVASVFFIGPLSAQSKAVHFKKLQDFLPNTKLEGFERKKPTGQTQTSMGMTTSEAKVRYEPEQKEEPGHDAPQSEESPPYVTFEVSISDVSGIPYGMMAAMAYQQEFENETEDGYEKSVTVKGSYKGKEEIRTGGSKQCDLEFIVGSRFIVKLEASGTDDVKLLYKLADGMDLAKLQKTTP